MTNNSITVNIDNLIENILPERIMAGLDEVCTFLVNEAQERCPEGTGNGGSVHIKESIDHTVTYENGVFTGRVGSNNEIAIYVHEGTGLYAIEGNGRKDVPWYFPVKDGGELNQKYGMPIRKFNGKEFYMTSGQKPNQFLREAIEENRDFILENFEGILTDD